MMLKIVNVLLPLPLNKFYQYIIPKGVNYEIGSIVIVPFGNRVLNGVIWNDVKDNIIAYEKFKCVKKVLTINSLSSDMMKFISKVSSYTISPIGSVLKMVMGAIKSFELPCEEVGYIENKSASNIKTTKLQKKVLNFLRGNVGHFSIKKIAEGADVSVSTIRSMIKKSILVASKIEHKNVFSSNLNYLSVKLSKSQKSISNKISEEILNERKKVFLVDGVTGSGKTEVYFEAVANALKQDKQVLILLPEISLGMHWVTKFNDRFGFAPTFWHSGLTAKQRRNAWIRVANGNINVVIGARSALFLPFSKLGLIVVDEEHDSSYKQEEGVIYNARDMSVLRGYLENIVVVLVSATPSLESLVNCQKKFYCHLKLTTRYSGIEMPEIKVVDMRKESNKKTKWLSAEVVKKIDETVSSGEQVMLFLNRRGYAPLTLCKKCGSRISCPNCSTWLVEHKILSQLLCHYCGHNIVYPKKCEFCDEEDSFVACGPGVEKIEEEISNIFPNFRHALVSSDVFNNPSLMGKLVNSIKNREIDILIGTQLLAKGYHFPMLTLVGVIDSDLGMAGGDLRAFEKTFQLLYQVSGRAGREHKRGNVLLQTYFPEHPVIKSLSMNDRDDFINYEISSRKKYKMPPFSRLVGIILSSKKELLVQQVVKRLNFCKPKIEKVGVFGPAPAPLYTIRKRYRWRFLIKADKNVNIQKIIKKWISNIKISQDIKIQIDVDPNSFL